MLGSREQSLVASVPGPNAHGRVETQAPFFFYTFLRMTACLDRGSLGRGSWHNFIVLEDETTLLYGEPSMSSRLVSALGLMAGGSASMSYYKVRPLALVEWRFGISAFYVPPSFVSRQGTTTLRRSIQSFTNTE